MTKSSYVSKHAANGPTVARCFFMSITLSSTSNLLIVVRRLVASGPRRHGWSSSV